MDTQQHKDCSDWSCHWCDCLLLDTVMYFCNIEKGSGAVHKCIRKPDPLQELCNAKRKNFLSSEHTVYGQNTHFVVH